MRPPSAESVRKALDPSVLIRTSFTYLRAVSPPTAAAVRCSAAAAGGSTHSVLSVYHSAHSRAFQDCTL